MSSSEIRRRRRWPWAVLVALVLVVAGSASAWAAMTVLRPASDPLDASSHTYVAVVPGEVGSSLNLNTVAEWVPVPVGVNRATGVVTDVRARAGDEVSQGATLYSVGLRPVIVAEGDVPAFRAVSKDVEGPDVAQVQRMLASAGFYGGPDDGEAGEGTVAAIKAWQKSLGLEETGIVEAGDLIFVPHLPTRIALDTKLVRRGATLAGGEEVLRGLPESPVFGIPVTESQANMIQPGVSVEVTSPDGDTWKGVTGDVTRDKETGTVTVAVSGADGAALCGEGCGQIPATGEVTLPSRIVTVPTVEGLVVPSSALVTTADGATAVINRAGKRVPVTVVSSAKGMSVVEGIDEGAKVRVPAKDEPAA